MTDGNGNYSRAPVCRTGTHIKSYKQIARRILQIVHCNKRKTHFSLLFYNTRMLFFQRF